MGCTTNEGPNQAQPSSARLLFPFAFDYVTYGIGMGLISIGTFFPMFLRSLTPSNVVIGLIPAIQMLGTAPPTAFIARSVERRARLKSFAIVTMFGERVWLLLAGLWIIGFGGGSPGLVVGGVLALWALYSAGNGCATLVGSNLMARMVPANLRGRIAGWGGGLSAFTGIAIALLVRYLVTTLGLRLGYGLAFAAAGLVMLASSLVFLLVREEDAPTSQQEMSLRAYLGQLPGLLRRDRAFGWFIAARTLWAVAATATSFYTVYAMARFGAGPTEVAWLSVAMSLGFSAGFLLGGTLGDSGGYRLVLIASSLALVLAPLGAIAAGHIALLFLVCLGDALGQSTGMVSGMNMPLELAPAGQVATYLAVNTMVLGPVRMVVSVAAGALAEWLGHPVLFAVAALAGLAATVVFFIRVPEPRRQRGDKDK